jgi:ABC-type glycerol-3-phosphate transport system permease component
MSNELVVYLIATAANLVGTLILQAWMAQGLTRLAWSGRGVFKVVAILIVTQLFWIVPAWLIVVPRDADSASPYALWFGNWIVTGFSIVLLSSTAKSIPRSLEDSARIDGFGAFAIWRQIVFPFVQRELVLIALFTVMATLIPFWWFLSLPRAGELIVVFQRFLSPSGRVAMMIAVSFLGTLVLITVFFLARRRSLALPPDRAQAHPPPLVRG